MSRKALRVKLVAVHRDRKDIIEKIVRSANEAAAREMLDLQGYDVQSPRSVGTTEAPAWKEPPWWVKHQSPPRRISKSGGLLIAGLAVAMWVTLGLLLFWGIASSVGGA